MNEDRNEQAQGETGGAPGGAGPSAGAMLRNAREAAGLHVAALAVSLKVPVRKLEALENDHYDRLTDAVFVRALASSVCRTLKIDSQPVLDRLPQMAAPRLTHDHEGLNMAFRGSGGGAPPTWLDQLSRPVFLAVFALLLGALVLILLPRAQQADSPAAGAEAKSVAPSARAEAPGLPVPSLPPAMDSQLAAVSPAAAATTVVAPAGVAAATRPAASAAAAPPLASPVAAALPAAPTSGIVAFRAKGPSWVEVIDANGVTAIRKMMAAGESAAASGALPLRVTVGRVDSTEVQVRGQPFDLRSVSHGNVARFEVK